MTAGAEILDSYPLAPMQRAMVFESLAAPESGAYVQHTICDIDERVDVAALRRAWDQVIARHAILATAFRVDGLAGAVQEVHRSAVATWAEEDWTQVPPVDRERRFERLIDADRARGFALNRAPLMRFTLLRFGERSWRLVCNYHHALLDGRGVRIAAREAFDLYDALAAGRDATLPPPPHAFREHVDWLARRDAAAARDYWRRTLSGFAAPTTLAGVLPRPQADVPRGTFEAHEIRLDRDTTTALTTKARRHGLTLYTVVLGAWAQLLARYSGERDIAFDTTVTLRGADEAFRDMVGALINTVPLRIDVPPAVPLAQWLAALRAQWVAMRPHLWAPLTDIVRWSGVPREHGNSASLVVFDHMPLDAAMAEDRPDWNHRRFTRRSSTAGHPLTLVAFGAPELSLKIVYDASLFERASIVAMVGHLATLLEGTLTAADAPLRDQPLLGAAEKRRLLVEWNGTAREFAGERCTHRRIEQQVERSPDAIAVESASRALTYRELNDRANALAHELRRAGVTTDTLVGVATGRTPELVVAMLGIMKAGGAWLVLDLGTPSERIARVIRDARLATIVATPAAVSGIPAFGGRTIVLDEHSDVRSTPNPVASVGADDLAYAIYTSGSTGEPKGIAITHRALTNHTLAAVERYTYTASDRRSQFASLSSDVLIAEVFPTLVVGGTLVLRPDAGILAIADFLRFLEAGRVTIAGMPSAYWHEWVAAMAADPHVPFPPSLRVVISGMDAVRPDRFAIWKRVAKRHVRWFNAYGPSETACTAAIYEADLANEAPLGVVPIGRPLPNVRIYLLDREMQPVPIGVPGEIHVGGAGVARGYVNRPELTAEKFVADPFSDAAASRLYRTGDIGRHLADGNIEFLGRSDDQVKIRGNRVEPAEVEAALARLPEIHEACVVARGESTHERRLVAYVVAKPGVQVHVTAVRERLRASLPHYMLPSTIVTLAALPLAASGKIDYRALPDPHGEAAREAHPGTASGNALEAALTAIWEALLRIPVGIEDRFFDIGGDSLSGLQLIDTVLAEFGVRIPPEALFEDAATIPAMASRIAAERAEPSADPHAATIPRRPADAPIPLSFTQAGAWFLQRLDPSGVAYNEARLWRIDGALDVDVLRAALAALTAWQPMLRTRFVVVDGHPRQVIDAKPDVALKVLDLSSSTTAEDDRLAAAVRERIERRFDLAAATPIRWTVFRLAAERFALLRVAHHIVGDAMSSRILHRALWSAYAAIAEGRAPSFPPLTVDYADFAVWQAREWSGEPLERRLAFWRERLADLPVLRLPTDFTRPPAQSFRGATLIASVPRDAANALKSIARRHGATPFVAFLGAFSALIGRLAATSDVAIGTPVAGRTLPELRRIVGFFANTVVVRADLSGTPTTEELLVRMRDTMRDVLAHQDAPFERVVDALGMPRDPSRNPLFQVAFATWEHDADEPPIPGLQCRRAEFETERAKFDLTATVVERPDRIEVRWEYCTDLFAHATIERMSRQYAHLLAAMAARPTMPIATLPLMDREAAERVVRTGIGAAAAADTANTIAGQFAVQARARPGAAAIDTLDYATLDAAANRLAHELRATGVPPRMVVAVARRASAHVAIAWLAVLKTGAAYLPIDPDVPTERIAYMLADARVTHAIADHGLAGALSAPGVSIICPDRDAERIAAHPNRAPDVATQPGDPAYVMYTSGSTGSPKGVVIPQRAVLGLVRGTDCAQLGPDDVVAQLANPAFDASTFEFWGALLNGARIAPIARTTAIAPRALAAAIAKERVSALFLTTALFNAVAREAPDAFRACRYVLFGGEAVEPRWVASVMRAGPPQQLLHVYGPTETTTFATWHDVRNVAPNAATVPIGRALAATEAFVLRDDCEPAAPGEPGEIWIGGPRLALGYLNASRDDAARFAERAVASLPSRRLYRTGDQARINDDGAIEYLGRRDRQVKIRGHRIELDEIEAAMTRLATVRAAAVALRGETTETRQLVAYLVAADPSAPPPADVRRELRRALPDYMVPAHIVWLKSLPLNASGKVDRRALPAITGQLAAAPGARVAPRDMLEQVLVGIWERVLGVTDIGIHDHFFEIGGHSLLAAELFDEIERETGVVAPLAALFADDTIAGLAHALRESPPELSAPIIALNAEGSRPPLVFLHGDLSGGGFYSRTLAHALGPGQPLLVVQPHGLGNAPIPDTIEAMAADRIAALRKLRPHGPYLLGGYCNGAFVAFEMARQLAAQGDDVPLVVVIEAPAPRARADDQPGEGETYVTFERGAARTLVPRDRTSEAQLRYSRAMDRYAGGAFEASFVLVRSQAGSDAARNAVDASRALGWTRFATRLELQVLPGDHVTLVTRHVGALAQVIREAIDRALERAFS